ncbi:MAG: sensor histidine kinase [Desulfobacterales bacterium]
MPILPLILAVALGYVGLLFAVAFWADRRAASGRSAIANPYVYALSLAVYCTAWTFYGSVGRAAAEGPAFLPTYLGPTLACALGFTVLRKMIRIGKAHRITSIADFLSSRYGKSAALAATVTCFAVVGLIPYIALQLKAVADGFDILRLAPLIVMPRHLEAKPFLEDTSFHAAWLLALFAMLFGTRKLEATERHEGIVAAVALESIVKLAAFVAVGLLAVAAFGGPAALFGRAAASPRMQEIFAAAHLLSEPFGWALETLLSFLAFLCLPRQFQVTVVENVSEDHLRKALWLFPLYLWAINLFVLPIAVAGSLQFPGGVDADTFSLALPLALHRESVALVAFVGGMSAATAMVIVEAVALATMISNDVVLPFLLRLPGRPPALPRDPRALILGLRRAGIVLVLASGYAYYRAIGQMHSLVALGQISFVAVAQFAPALLGGLYWKHATRRGALGGLVGGYAVWFYTLIVPALVDAGLLGEAILARGPAGLGWLRPVRLLGLEGLNPIAHACFWSLIVNLGLFVGLSLLRAPEANERAQAELFVDAFSFPRRPEAVPLWRGKARVGDLRLLLERFLGPDRTEEALQEFARHHRSRLAPASPADPALVTYAEGLLAGAVGSASARVMVASVVQEKPLRAEEILEILEENRAAISYSRELERLAEELRSANRRLEDLDRLKDEFIATVTHELRTPLAAVRSIAESLQAHPQMPEERRRSLTAIVVKESERLGRLVDQVLDFQRLESRKACTPSLPLDLHEVWREAAAAMRPMLDERGIRLALDAPDTLPPVFGDRDRLLQVAINLLSNALKFCPDHGGRIDIRIEHRGGEVRSVVSDNGPGIPPEDREAVFEPFYQVRRGGRGGRPAGTGLGLAIVRRILEHHGGWIRAESGPEGGAAFHFGLPLQPPPPPPAITP